MFAVRDDPQNSSFFKLWFYLTAFYVTMKLFGIEPLSQSSLKTLQMYKDADYNVKVLERCRTEAPKQFMNGVKYFAWQYLLRDGVIKYLTEKMDVIYPEYERTGIILTNRIYFFLIPQTNSPTQNLSTHQLPKCILEEMGL